MKIKYTVAALMLLTAGFAAKAQPELFKVTDREQSREPISPLLYGNFIELGYGLQVEPMWSEMFFNRSFENFPPYKIINKLWYDVMIDEKDHSKGYERDWSKYDWYHSGYQHNEWYAAPGTPASPSYIDDTCTFFRLTTPLRKVRLEIMEGGSGHGRQSLRVINDEASEWGALAQDGKLFRKGETYGFSGKMRAADKPADAEIRIYRQGEWTDPLQAIPLTIPAGDSYADLSASINSAYDGYVTFSLWIPPQTDVYVDDFSLKPRDNYYGWRPEVVEVFKELAPRIVRFPGGCFASFYDWKEGVGPYSERVPQDSYFWGGQNYNDVGTAEFAMLCKAAGAQMQMCVNVYHPSKRRYDVDFTTWQADMGYNFTKFMSLSEGARQTADWVAYCNLPAGTHPMADLRAAHGYPEPFGVQYWELDNETARWYEADDYAWACVVYSEAMKAVDPTIRIGMVTYGDRPDGTDYHRDLERMLEIAGPHIDFLADRADADKLTRHIMGKLRKYNADHGTDIKYCDTEWLAYNTETKRDAFNLAERQGEATKSYLFSKWMYAMTLLKNFMSFQRMGEPMWFVNFNNLANTHSQNVMDTPKEGAYLSASGRALQLLSNSPAAWVLGLDGYTPAMNDEYQVQAAWDKDRRRLVLYVCNRTDKARKASFDLGALGREFPQYAMNRLSAPSPVTMNNLENPDAIKVERTTGKSKMKKGIYEVAVPAWSFSEIILE